MKTTVHNVGSLNIDDVFSLDHIARAGETMESSAFNRFAGGKGLNQSLALARAGARVCHYGRIAQDGAFLRSLLESEGVNCSGIVQGQEPTGHAIIQVAKSGENAIVLYGGANQSLDSTDIERLLAQAHRGDVLLLQNEVNLIPQCMRAAHAHGLRIAMNPSPMTEKLLSYPLELLTWLVVNEIEAAALANINMAGADGAGSGSADGGGAESDVLQKLHSKFPQCIIVMTLGERGAVRIDKAGMVSASFPAPAEVVDTTAAGDTFMGYWLQSELQLAPQHSDQPSGKSEGQSQTQHSDQPSAQPTEQLQTTADSEGAKSSLLRACAAAAISVTRAGAGASIPSDSEVQSLLAKFS